MLPNTTISQSTEFFPFTCDIYSKTTIFLPFVVIPLVELVEYRVVSNGRRVKQISRVVSIVLTTFFKLGSSSVSDAEEEIARSRLT